MMIYDMLYISFCPSLNLPTMIGILLVLFMTIILHTRIGMAIRFRSELYKDGDNVAFDGERYNLHREFLTDSEFAELQSMRSNYAALVDFKN